MKANEAPEKIYLQEPTKVRTEKKYDNDVEYTRTDVFIEKAEEYIYEQLHEGRIECGDIKRFVENMKKYMKGE